MKGNRCVKELNEIAPVIAWCREQVCALLKSDSTTTFDGGAAAGSDDHAAAGGAAVPASRPTSQSWTGKIEVIDLCSGFGYLGMFLSEMLPPSKVSKITLVDKCWSVIPQPPSSPSPTHTLFPQPLCFCLNSPILLRTACSLGGVQTMFSSILYLFGLLHQNVPADVHATFDDASPDVHYAGPSTTPL